MNICHSYELVQLHKLESYVVNLLGLFGMNCLLDGFAWARVMWIFYVWSVLLKYFIALDCDECEGEFYEEVEPCCCESEGKLQPWPYLSRV